MGAALGASPQRNVYHRLDRTRSLLTSVTTSARGRPQPVSHSRCRTGLRLILVGRGAGRFVGPPSAATSVFEPIYAIGKFIRALESEHLSERVTKTTTNSTPAYWDWIHRGRPNDARPCTRHQERTAAPPGGRCERWAPRSNLSTVPHASILPDVVQPKDRLQPRICDLLRPLRDRPDKPGGCEPAGLPHLGLGPGLARQSKESITGQHGVVGCLAELASRAKGVPDTRSARKPALKGSSSRRQELQCRPTSEDPTFRSHLQVWGAMMTNPL